MKGFCVVVIATVLSVVMDVCHSASIAQPTANKQKQQQAAAAKQQQTTSNNLAFALQDHRLGGGRHGVPQQQQPEQTKEGELNLADIQPVQLQFCFRAIQFVMQTAHHVQEVNDITSDEQLPIIIADVAGSAQKAFIYSEIAIGQSGEPVAEAMAMTKNATITARNAANLALKLASGFSATQPGSENSHKAVQAAQQSTLTAQSAQHQILQAGAGVF